MWLSVAFAFMIVETLLMEMRERFQSSDYWSEHRNRSKCITYLTVFMKEVAEYSWQIYGAVLYFSKESDGCSDENGGFMFIMVLFLIMSAFKLLLVLVVIGILSYVLLSQRLKRRSDRAASKDILRSLAKIKYSALSLGQGETDEECSICFCPYGEDDIVTKLECNERHVFHEQCISSWISQGKNSCPICRAPINS